MTRPATARQETAVPRPPNPLLSGERIRQGALEIVDAHGLEGLSMRRLAEHLGVKAASLYNHVSTKDDLLQEIANELMGQVDVSGFSTDWPTGLMTWARSYRAVLAAHPNLVPYIAAGPGRREEALRGADAIHGGLTQSGWPQRYATMIGASVKYLVVGAALGFSGGFVDDAEVYEDRFPHLERAHLLRQHAAEIDNASFELALSSLITGLRQIHSTLGSE